LKPLGIADLSAFSALKRICILRHHDGSEFEKRYAKALSVEKKNSGVIGHNVGHNLPNLED